MFISFSKLLAKVGGFHIGLKGRVTSKNVFWGSLIYLTVVMFQLMWYSALLVGWLFYAFIYGSVVLTKKMFNILSGQVGKLKAGIILTVVYSGIILILILVSSASGTTTPTETPTQPTIAETTMQSTTEATTEVTTEVTTEATTEATEATTEPLTEPTVATVKITKDYVLNTNTRKFHYPSCSSAKQIKDSNKTYFTGTRDEVIQMGYSPCGRCTP